MKVMGKPVKFEGVSEELQKLLEADMDQAGPRRRAREAFKNIQLSIDHILFKVPAIFPDFFLFISVIIEQLIFFFFGHFASIVDSDAVVID